MNPINIQVAKQENDESMECIESFLLSPLSPNKSHTLVLDIDETLLSVRRWIDEIQINDSILYSKTNKLHRVTKITKEVTLQYDDGAVNVYSFYFDEQHPFAQLNSSLDIGDRMDIGARLASVKEVFTSYITIYDEDSQSNIEMNCINEDYLHEIQYVSSNNRDGKFSVPDLVYNNMYVVRFRCDLASFFSAVTSHDNLEIVLWTAAVRSVYTDLMHQVHDLLLSQIDTNASTLWSHILFRDNCSCRENGSYLKNLSLLNRDMDKVIMIDNISFNFEGFEYNGLPINEYWGHPMDKELTKLVHIIDELLNESECDHDVRRILHRIAFNYDFSAHKLDQMVRYLAHNDIQNDLKAATPSLFDEDEVIEMEFTSSQSNNESEDDREGFLNHDSTPTTLNVSEASLSQSNELDDDEHLDHLDFYLFNFSMDLMDDEDDDMFDDVDPTLLFNENYNNYV